MLYIIEKVWSEIKMAVGILLIIAIRFIYIYIFFLEEIFVNEIMQVWVQKY